jgi:hypothetical protein
VYCHVIAYAVAKDGCTDDINILRQIQSSYIIATLKGIVADLMARIREGDRPNAIAISETGIDRPYAFGDYKVNDFLSVQK